MARITLHIERCHDSLNELSGKNNKSRFIIDFFDF